MNKDTLLVEGKSDQLFFKFLIANHKKLEEKEIEISPPKPLGSDGDGVDGIIDMLPNLLKFKAFGGSLGIVLDADYEPKGFNKRRDKIIEIIKEEGYDVSIPLQSEPWKGDIFPHPELSPVGLWIMPNHQIDGMFETLMLDTIPDGIRSQLLARLKMELENILSIDEFREIRLKASHKDKTLLNTWLYWQKQPSTCKSDDVSIIECALKEGWLNPEHDNIKALTSWLTRVFQ